MSDFDDVPSIKDTYCKHHYGLWPHECGCEVEVEPRKRKVRMINEDLKQEIDRLKAENTRLREALERIDSECSRDDTSAWKIASDALEELK